MELSRDSAIVGVGFNARISDTSTLTLSYQGEFGDGLADHSVSLRWMMRF